MTEPLNQHASETLARLSVDPVGNITSEHMHKDPDTGAFMYDDAAALKLVIEDAARADNYANINQWASLWTQSDVILQSPGSTSAFDGGNVAMANVPKFTLSNHLSSIVPKVLEGLFYEDPPFILRPRPGTKQEVTRAKTALFSAQLWDMKFKSQFQRGIAQMALLGTTIFKWGYLEHPTKIKKYRRAAPPAMLNTSVPSNPIDTPDSDAFEMYVDVIKTSRPWIKYTDIRTVLVDPGCRVG